MKDLLKCKVTGRKCLEIPVQRKRQIHTLKLFSSKPKFKKTQKCKTKSIETSFLIAIMMIGLVLIIVTKIC